MSIHRLTNMRTVPSVIRLFVILILVGFAGCSAEKDVKPPAPASEPQPAVTQPSPPDKIVFEEPDLPHPTPEGVKTPEQENLPRIAIIIDDMGYHQKLGDKLLELPLNLTFSFLPYAPFTEEQRKLALDKGRDILLHLPMEPHDKKWDPGPDALYLSQPLSTIPAIIDKDLAAVHGVIGVNNHMGSLYTENRQAIREVMKELKKKDLFFIDSYTSSKSVAMDEARKMGVLTARRQVFLDNIHTQKDICNQLELLIKIAKKQGWAIGIGHPNRETLLALTRCHNGIFQDVQLVSVRQLVQ